MDHLTYKEQLAEGLKNDSAIDVQTAIRAKIDEVFQRKLNLIKEQGDQRNAALEVMMAAKSFGGEDADEHNGVIAVYFRSKQGAEHFLNYLEGCDVVETYEMNGKFKNRETDSSEDVVDFDAINDDRQYEFQVIVYLYPEYSEFNADYDEDGDEDGDDAALEYQAELEAEGEEVQHDGEQIDEVIRKIRVNSRGKKTIKMQCAPGFRWDPHIEACVKITGQELAVMRKASRRALITKRSEGSAFKVRLKRRIKRAFKFRQMMGMRV